MARKTLSYRIRGVAPLIMCNGDTANPFNPWARALKEISGKRKKTDEDYQEMARLEWMGHLYLYKGEPCIPGDNLEGMLIGKRGAARSQRMGKQGAAGLYVLKNFPLEYEGPRDPIELWELPEFRYQRMVKIGPSAKVLRTRVIFEEWEATVEIQILTDLVNVEDANHWMQIASREVGLMDRRPKYGRFEVVS